VDEDTGEAVSLGTDVETLVAPPAKKLVPHVLLFLLTVLTMLTAGAMQEITGHVLDIVRAPELLSHGVIYTLALLAIMVAHDLGRFFAAHAHDVEISFPYYIPAPTLFGTLGSVVMTGRPPRDKRALFDLGAAGVLAGFAVALPMAAMGIAWSEPLDTPFGAQALSEPLFFEWLVRVLKPEALDGGLRLHPLALAAWTGMLITALGLIPVGQLDGGHVVYALLGRAQMPVGAFALAVLVSIGVFFQAPLWIAWALIALIVGHTHPPIRTSTVQLGVGRWLVAALLLFVLIGSFALHPSAAGAR
jgi:membrane-associated protease RseP (regulator of RpoE activity)